MHPRVFTCTRTHTHARTCARTVTGRASPSLPRLRGCLFRRGVLAARPRLELQRVLGGRGDLVGPGGGELLSPGERRPSLQTPAPLRPAPRESPTHHLTHVARLALLSGRSWQTLRTGGHQTLGQWAWLQHPPTSAASQLSAPKSLGMCMSATHEDGSEILSQN